DVCIWQGTLSVSDLQTLGKSRVKGICRTIQPSSLIAYFDLDSWGDGTQVDDYEYPSRIVATEAYPLNVNGGASVLSKAESFLTYK
ncbi:MAG TPA: hypothetical protein PK745_15300, partial [bacterium]|nr:hypothetical protein [bacterium]